MKTAKAGRGKVSKSESHRSRRGDHTNSLSLREVEEGPQDGMCSVTLLSQKEEAGGWWPWRLNEPEKAFFKVLGFKNIKLVTSQGAMVGGEKS